MFKTAFWKRRQVARAKERVASRKATRTWHREALKAGSTNLAVQFHLAHAAVLAYKEFLNSLEGAIPRIRQGQGFRQWKERGKHAVKAGIEAKTQQLLGSGQPMMNCHEDTRHAAGLKKLLQSGQLMAVQGVPVPHVSISLRDIGYPPSKLQGQKRQEPDTAVATGTASKKRLRRSPRTARSSQ
jgi:hypothetical protein